MDTDEKRYPLSVIVPIHRPDVDVRRCLLSLLKNPNLDLQIIIAANSDKKSELQRINRLIPDLPCITLLNIPKAGKANAINEALHYVENEYVLIGDADTLFVQKGINLCLEKLYSDESIVAITGIVAPIIENRIGAIQKFEYRRIFRIFRPFWNLFHANLIVSGCAGIFKTEPLIDAIEIVCHKDWIDYTEELSEQYGISKKRWICTGGKTFQDSVMNGLLNLKGKVDDDDIVVISFGVSPMTCQEDIDDSIKVCREHGNAIASADIVLSTCVIDDKNSSVEGIPRETLKCFANPWSFKYGELCEVYEEAMRKDILKDVEPHTTSLYFALGKRIWFSRSTSVHCKITHKGDLDLFEGWLLLKEKKENDFLENIRGCQDCSE